MPANLIGLNPGGAYVVTPSDTVALPKETVSVYIGAAGTLTVVMVADYKRELKKLTAINSMPSVLFSGLVAGSTLNIRCSVIKATGTSVTATNVIALVDES